MIRAGGSMAWLGLLLATCLFLPLSAGAQTAVGISRLGFSPDSTRLIFNLCRQQQCEIAVYHRHNRTLHSYRPAVGQSWSTGSYSADGAKIAFISNDAVAEERSLWRQVSIMNADGSGVRIITDSRHYKINPSFSHDMKKIIYARAGVTRRTEQRDWIGDWDIYEVDIVTGHERQLTDHQFFSMDRPYYLPDDRRFLFSADGMRKFGEIRTLNPVKQEAPKAYRDRYRGNHIYIKEPGDPDLSPALIHGAATTRPRISADGTRILFTARTNELDNNPDRVNYRYDLFLKEGEDIRRLTKSGHYILDSALSADGRLLAFISGEPSRPKLFVMSAEGGAPEGIDLPASATAIN
ncbi:hypothetical protein [Ferrovibrio sp.]|uniref:hypothetical protein n=1 Tax=Ferrovibrio sp. TaxID=1917215 RepID=UPI000CB62145|nr:hypothetical protein [Ferrovibrio sp.]PJI38989.1 MAG: hypothetical protein CTR53_13800 [Ferrovibrio sp.]